MKSAHVTIYIYIYIYRIEKKWSVLIFLNCTSIYIDHFFSKVGMTIDRHICICIQLMVGNHMGNSHANCAFGLHIKLNVIMKKNFLFILINTFLYNNIITKV